MLRVVHPSQAEAAEREYLLARFTGDWATLTSALLATHSLPTALNGRNLLVLCDHNTFANELSLIAPAVEKKIAANYGVTIKIHARASKRINWHKPENPAPEKSEPRVPVAENRVLEKLIAEMQSFE